MPGPEAGTEWRTPVAVEPSIRYDFVLINAGWTVSRARELLNAIPGSYVVVFRVKDRQEYYYLRTREEIIQLFEWALPGEPIGRALDLHEWGRTGTLD